MKTNGPKNINRAFRAFRKNDCLATRQVLAMVILAQADCDEEREIAFPIVAALLGTTCTRSEVHKMLVSAASRTGVDIGTLSGGPTPED
jgi:hypothetical protein